MTAAQALQLLETRIGESRAVTHLPRPVAFSLIEADGIADALRGAIDAAVYAPKPDPPRQA